MSLRSMQTRILTQRTDPSGLLDYIAASLRVYDVTNASNPRLLGAIALTLAAEATVVISSVNPNILFVTDGRLATNLLYSVDVSEPNAPRVLDSLGLI